MNLFDIVRSIKSMFGLLMGKSKLASKGDTGCLVVGMEKSSKYGACPGARKDSDSMSKVLSDYGHIMLLQDKEATSSAVKSGLDQIVRKDLAIFYYSGHGGQETKSGEQTEFLCLNDGPLHDTEIWKRISCSAGRVVCIFDCCHSGTMYRHAGMEGEFKGMLYLHADELEPLYPGFEFSMLSRMPRMAGENNILVWSGCPAESYSYGDSSGGVFTNGILSGLGCMATYDSVWRRAKSAASLQKPVRTVIGTGFSGLVFR